MLVYLWQGTPSNVGTSKSAKHKWIGSSGRPFLPTLKTDACKSAPGERPLLQYALMVDAGSTGSRIHVYRFNYCKGLTPTLEDELFIQTKPGLSHFADSPQEAAETLDVLMEATLETIPKQLWKCSPLAVKATAGLRLLGEDRSNKILEASKKRLESKYPFKLVKDGVMVMDGKDEGVFAWITVNYLLGNLDVGRTGTVAIMDLGGASTQIVFQPTQQVVVDDHKAEVRMSGSLYTLYQHSFLGYGLMQARQRIKAGLSAEKDHPCLPKNFKDEDAGVQFTVSEYQTCAVSALEAGLFNKTAECPATHTCAFDGVYMPPIRSSFPGEIVAFSYFYDRFNPLNLPERLQIKEIGRWAELVCDHDDEEHHHKAPGGSNRSDLTAEEKKLMPKIQQLAAENPHFCMDMTYMHALLTVGYDIPEERYVSVVKKIDGYETGWCLGATLEMVDKMWDPSSGHEWVNAQCGA